MDYNMCNKQRREQGRSTEQPSPPPLSYIFLKKGSTFIIGYKKAQVNRECASSQSGTRWVVLCFRVAIIRVTKEEGSSDVTARKMFDTDPAMNYY